MPLLMGPTPHPFPLQTCRPQLRSCLGWERTLFVPTNTMANLISGEHGRPPLALQALLPHFSLLWWGL